MTVVSALGFTELHTFSNPQKSKGQLIQLSFLLYIWGVKRKAFYQNNDFGEALISPFYPNVKERRHSGSDDRPARRNS